jgi:predicted transposase/invertase (TIGR01784 family)
MSFDNICKFLCKQYPEQYALWLVKDLNPPVRIMESELSNEPVRADSVVFLQARDRILHYEFQVEPLKSEPPLSLRMLDYWVRLYRQYRMPIEQVVILLRDSPVARNFRGEFIVGRTSHYFHVVRLWEEDPNTFLQNPALLPLAVLAQTNNPADLLNQVARRIKRIDNMSERETISGCTQILAGLRYEKQLIRSVFKEGMMRESVIYQEILQEGLDEGLQKGRQEASLLIVSRLIQRKFGVLEYELPEQLQKLSVEKLEELAAALLDFQNIDELKDWLQKNQ